MFKEKEPERVGEMPSERPEPPVKRLKTRHCPACESGMEAPGSRHSKEYTRRNQEAAKRSTVNVGKSTHDESTSEMKDLGDMKHDLKHSRSAIDDELANELGWSSESRAVERHGVSSEDLAVRQ